ncbi:hypothetical protein C8F04DRAFT_741365 [Mycena alexandri]|uniref:Uncharacterized protein n=1 Tax=Mycena alexandri TaxID=1745969 RepID=A0AAD6WZ95_9AGAR|nr:hypothetical protein C8F04DRAFT_741365 [Mycena alexandri]
MLPVYSNTSAFDFEKRLNKLLKVEAAILTLHGLAISARRNHIVEKTLRLHEVKIPGRQTTILNLDHFVKFLPEDPIQYAKMKSLMSKDLLSTADGVTIKSKVHSEVQLVAWVAQNLNKVAPEVTLMPYVTCSKLHCFACFIWLQEFNQLNHTTLPCLAFDGCHGGLQRGWLPPSFETAAVLEKMTSRLETEFLEKHVKHSSGRSKGYLDPEPNSLDDIRGKFQRA